MAPKINASLLGLCLMLASFTATATHAQTEGAPPAPVMRETLAGGLIAADTPPSMVPFMMALVSCFDQKRDASIVSQIANTYPSLLLMLGDNVYGDSETADLVNLKAAYRMAANKFSLSAFAEIEAIWDDHDFGRNDGGADYPHKQAAKALFLEHFKVADNDPRRFRPGLYHSFRRQIGGVDMQVIMLDTRWFRVPLTRASFYDRVVRGQRYAVNMDATASMLGKAQWQWLKQELAQPADVRLIVSSVQVLARDHGFEKWHNFPLERTRLLQAVAARNGGVAAFVSGDRHISAFYRSEPVTRADGTQEQFTELTVGSANAPWTSAHEQDALQISPLYVKTGSFSLIEIDPKAAEMRFAVMNDKGSRELLYKLPLKQSQNR